MHQSDMQGHSVIIVSAMIIYTRNVSAESNLTPKLIYEYKPLFIVSSQNKTLPNTRSIPG